MRKNTFVASFSLEAFADAGQCSGPESHFGHKSRSIRGGEARNTCLNGECDVKYLHKNVWITRIFTIYPFVYIWSILVVAWHSYLAYLYAFSKSFWLGKLSSCANTQKIYKIHSMDYFDKFCCFLVLRPRLSQLLLLGHKLLVVEFHILVKCKSIFVLIFWQQ